MTETLVNKQSDKYEGLWTLVGNTPMIAIRYNYHGHLRTIYAKCEHYNLTGSIKDRMALYILQKAHEQGELQPGQRIVEATSGNTGISLAAIGSALGHPVSIIMPDWLSRERIDIIQSLGAEVILMSREAGGFGGSIALSEKLAAENASIFLPRQFANRYNAEAHMKTTAREIIYQLESQARRPTAFVAGVGTGGTLMGLHACFEKAGRPLKVFPLEPAESPTLSTGHKIGTHRIQGISDEFIPAILKLDKLQPPIQASDGDAILMAQRLGKQLGLAVGISSGANIIGAIKVQQELGEDAVVVTVLPDSNKKYLSTDLLKEEPLQDHYVSVHTEFLDYTPIQRL